MSLSLLYRQVVYFALFMIPGQCAIDKSENLLESCKYPVVQSRFFDDENVASKQPPELHVIDSIENVDKEFPYQFVFMSCNAPYPVEWIANVPQHYLYSYILDDEVRSISNDNVGIGHVLAHGNGNQSFEKFTVRLHIGNETFPKDTYKNISAICQPVEPTDSACGNTLVSIRKYKSEPPRNKTMLRIQISNIPLDIHLKNDALSKDFDQESNCSTKMENKTFKCNSTITSSVGEIGLFNSYSFRRDSVTCTDGAGLASQMEINETSLMPPNGMLTCSVYENEEEYSYNIPYFFSLPKFCPNEDDTLPRLYYGKGNSNEIASAFTESNFLSLCVQNASTSDIYIGDTVTVTCISSIYYFAQGMRIQLTTALVEHDLGKSVKEQSFGLGGYRNITDAFVLSSDSTLQVKCSAPVRKSRKWVVQSVEFKPKVPVKVSFQHTSETAKSDATGGTAYLVCNASGDPLPELFWSRLNNEKLPANQTTLHDNVSSAWISSTLHFLISSNNNETEYYGRYICTAKNKFNSVEKIFLFDEKSIRDETFVFGDNTMFSGFFGRDIWLWMIVALALLMLVGTIALLGWKLRKQAQSLRLFTKDEIDDFLFGNPDLLLDDTDAYEEMNTYAAYLPYDSHQFEIEREQLEFDMKDILGTGAYGTVYKGIFKGDCGKVEPVAIKTVNPVSDKMYFAALLSEIKIMSYIGKHGNVVGLVGACTKYLDQRQIFVATEYCPNGDMLSYILKHRNTFIKNAGLESKRETKNWVKQPGSNGYCRLAYARLLLSPHLLLVWALQIAQGMTYLSSKKVIHGDLAARNVLLSGDLKPKIGDFGLSKQLQKYANYVRKGDDLVPWRWLAVECHQFMKFSIKSDVWAFGVVLFELFSLGQVPYGSHTYSELFIVALCQGERLQQPTFASDKVYGLMLDCWKHAPENRPCFASLEDELRIMCAESERKMLLSISNSPGVSIATNDTLETGNHVSRPNYINTLVQEKKTQGRSPYIRRNGNVADKTKNGYVSEIQPTTTNAYYQFQANAKYVDHPGLSILSPPLPSKSYVDWNVANA